MITIIYISGSQNGEQAPLGARLGGGTQLNPAVYSLKCLPQVFSIFLSLFFAVFIIFLWTLKSHLLPPAVSHVHCFLHVVCTSPGNNQFPECSWLSCLSECWGREGRGVVFVNSQPCQDMPSLPALNVLVWFLWWEWPLGRRETPHLNLQRAEFDFL